MKNILKTFATALTVVFLSTGAWADAEGLVVKASPHSVAKTLDQLEAKLKELGIAVFARVDHTAGAKKVDLELAPTQVLIFGNPKIGTPVMQSKRTIGIDLPMKMLAWKDKDGKVWVAYNSPEYLAKRHGIEDREKVFAKMGGALDKLSNAAIKK